MQFKLGIYIRNELYQLKDIDNKNVYLEIKITRSSDKRIYDLKYKEHYSKGFFNHEQIKEIVKMVEQLADNKYITEIVIELNRGD